MSKKIIALCLALVMVLSMTACSAPAQTAEPEQTAEPATKASTAETPTADARPVIGSAIQYDPNVPINDGKDIEVELWFWSGAANLFQSLADQYTAIHPNVTILGMITSPSCLSLFRATMAPQSLMCITASTTCSSTTWLPTIFLLKIWKRTLSAFPATL